jgi:hypothetical protein
MRTATYRLLNHFPSDKKTLEVNWMNRTLVLGIAIFFAVVCIALLGNQNQAVAGLGCSGCDGFAVKGCSGRARCHGQRHAFKSRCSGATKHAGNRCCGSATKCSGASKCSGRRDRCSGKRVRTRCSGRKSCSGSSCSGGKWSPVEESVTSETAWQMDGSFAPAPVAFRGLIFRR